MKNIENQVDCKEQYVLDNNFILLRADEAEFGVHYAIYLEVDQELSYSWDYISHYSDVDDCQRFWIMKDNKRLGGVIIEPNYLSHFFIEPPYTVALFDIVKELDKALMSWANKDEKTYIYVVNPEQVEIFNKLGYRH